MKEYIDRSAAAQQAREEIFELLKEYCRETGSTAVISAKHIGGWIDTLTVSGDSMSIKSGTMSARTATEKMALDVIKRAKTDDLWAAVGGDFHDLRRFYELKDFYDDDIKFTKKVMDDLQKKPVGTKTELHFKDEAGKLHTLAFKKTQDDFLHPEENIIAILDGRKASEAVVKQVLTAVEDIDKMAALTHEKEIMMRMLKARAMAIVSRVGITAARRMLGEVRKSLTVEIGNR